MNRDYKCLGKFLLCLIVIVLLLLFLNNRERFPSFNNNQNEDAYLELYDEKPNNNMYRNGGGYELERGYDAMRDDKLIEFKKNVH